jgi:glycine dehydrogenase
MLKKWQNQADFTDRHIGIQPTELTEMLAYLGCTSLDAFLKAVIPTNLLAKTPFMLDPAEDEATALAHLQTLLAPNQILQNRIGLGYHESITPPVLLRNVFHNPGWYTAYTPYQAEISQGRLEVLLHFQHMVMDLTGFDLANASLLDEATAAAEAMSMAKRITQCTRPQFFVADTVLPQTLNVVQTRAHYFGFEIVVGPWNTADQGDYFGALFQYPDVNGHIDDLAPLFARLKTQKTIVITATDLLHLTLFPSPASLGADIALGNSQRFGIPLGFGGPHAAFFATRDEYKRTVPGRIIGASKDVRGHVALRLALQTREQHIRREKANSNICTSQVLLANMAALYAMYHGPVGLNNIASRVHYYANSLRAALVDAGHNCMPGLIFDTVTMHASGPQLDVIRQRARAAGYNLRYTESYVAIAFAETSTPAELPCLFEILTGSPTTGAAMQCLYSEEQHLAHYAAHRRQDPILTHPDFTAYHTETQMMRYLKSLENKDLSLTQAMIPLGSCTMKLNAAAQLIPVSWPSLAALHPFCPPEQQQGYQAMLERLSHHLQTLTGFAAISFQPNSGAQGEYAGLLAIRRYQAAMGEGQRDICLIPKSAHGTNPATAQMMGLKVVAVECDERGNVSLPDLRAKASHHKAHLSALMLTYPSTHGVFETAVIEIMRAIHDNGGQVYMDGANFNALVGFVKPAELGADVMHMNLHKTFAIPHGGGGPGMGPIGVKAHLAPFLPEMGAAVSAAPAGSASILAISWMYITLLGASGLKAATSYALLNANYLAKAIAPAFPVLYTGDSGWVAHECIFDMRPLKAETGISEVDIAKRLMDYGFHPPTMSFPVPGTLMVEPTESEDKYELDRFIEAMIAIRAEIEQVKQGTWDRQNNPLKNAPHTQADVRAWDKPYSIEVGCYPSAHTRRQKYWPSVNRIDDVQGDRTLICSCYQADL